MEKRLLAGVDVGTSGAKCIIADEDGRVLASSTQEYPLSTPKPGWAEQNPADWWDGVARGLREITAKVDVSRLVGLSMSGQMHGLVALDKDDRVIRPAMLWCDQRVYKQCDWITARAGGVRVVKLIHGYGSSGAGGAIRADVHRQLAEKKAAGSIRAWVRGEDFSPFDADSRAILEACPPLRKDPDLIRQNHRVTFVLL